MPSEGIAISQDNYSSDSNHVYHLQSQYSRKALLAYFGEGDRGKFVLDVIVRISKVAVVSYPGEKDLQVYDIDFSPVSLVDTCFLCDISKLYIHAYGEK